uniref:Musashi RNA-binding protein 2b n=1 Tax=Oncorhynchus mykiss TaxID=8022 RepID=A0A8C7T775_ONCMY
MEGDGSQATSGGNPNDSQHDPGNLLFVFLCADSLRDYFTKFGEIRECMVMRDPTTKRSRGFGFVTYIDAASVDNVLAQQHHELDSKTIDPKVAFPRRAQPKMVTRTKKIFVGGLSANTVVEDVKQYFEQFGKVEDAMLMFDKTTNRHRGKVLVIDVHLVVYCPQVECKKAQPKEVMFPPGTRGRARGLPYTMDAFMLGMGMLSQDGLTQLLIVLSLAPLGYPNIVATYGRGYTGFAPSYSYQFPGFPATAYGPVAAAAVAAVRGSGRGARGRGGYMAYQQNAGAAFPGTNSPGPGAFPGTNSPGPVADLYGTPSQDSGVGNYISAASPQPGSGFGHSIAVSIAYSSNSFTSSNTAFIFFVLSTIFLVHSLSSFQLVIRIFHQSEGYDFYPQKR